MSIYEFGPFSLDSSERLLLREGKPIPLTAKVFDVLFLLVRQSGRLVEKSEIMKEVWSNSVVEDSNLTVSMSALRRALGETRGRHDYIETVPKRGYRFVAAVRVSDVTKAHHEEATVGEKAGAAVKTLAILPFEVLSQELNEKYIGLGMADALITALSHVKQIVVLPTRTVSKYARPGDDPETAGRRLGVEAALDGQIQKSGESIRVTVQLTDVRSGSLLWGEKFYEKFTDILAVQDSIAEQVVRGLMIKVSGEEQRLLTKHYTDNLEALEAYMNGRYYWNKRSEEGLKKAIVQFSRAIELDPDFALAYVGLADTYALLSDYSLLPPRQAMPKAMAAARRALEIDETLTEAKTTLAYVSTFYGWEWARAEERFKQAIKLNQNYATAHHWYALYLAAVGRFERAIAEIRRALELDPLSLVINANLAIIFLYSGKYEEAIRQCRKTLDLDPDFGVAHLYLGLAYERAGRFDEAIAELQQARVLSDGSSRETGVLGYIFAVAGQTAKARKLLEELEKLPKRRYVSPFDVALIHIGLGERDRAFEWLEKAYEERSDWLAWVKVAGELDGVRSDPRFADLIRRIGLERRAGEDITSLMVLPLRNTSGDENLAYLADGITESIINNLSPLSSLKVMAPSTAFRYKGQDVDPRDLGARLSVGAVLAGKILQLDDSLVIKMELVNVADGSQIWGEQYSRPFSDLLSMQEEIAHEVSEKLRLKLSRKEKERIGRRYTESVEAYHLYLKGRYFWSKYTVPEVQKGLDYFQRAINVDPNYALAYAGLADSYQRLSNFIFPPEEAMPKATAAATKALEIDDTVVEAYLALGLVKMYYYHDWQGAESDLKRAVNLAPGSPLTHQRYATFLMYMGRLEEALAENNLARELDPLSLPINSNHGTILYLLRRYDETIAQLRTVLEMEPRYYQARANLGLAYIHKGEFSKGLAMLKSAKLIDNNPVILGLLGYSYGVAGKRAEAESVLEDLKEMAKRAYVSPFSMALIYTGLGKKKEAFRWLRKTYEEQNDWLVWFKVGPELDSLRSDPRFIDLLRRISFPSDD